MLALIPLIVMGGVALKFTDEFIRQPLQTQRKKARRFDEQEYKDLKVRGKGLGFGNFSNIGW